MRASVSGLMALLVLWFFSIKYIRSFIHSITTYMWIANCSFFYCTDYITYLYMHCNFICGLSDVIIKTFSQSPSRIVSYRIFSNRIRCDTILYGIFTCAQHLTSSQLNLAHWTASLSLRTERQRNILEKNKPNNQILCSQAASLASPKCGPLLQ